MSNLSIKDVFKARVELKRQCSARHHRSFQGESMTLIEPAVQTLAERLTRLVTVDKKPDRAEQKGLPGLA